MPEALQALNHLARRLNRHVGALYERKAVAVSTLLQLLREEVSVEDLNATLTPTPPWPRYCEKQKLTGDKP